MGGLSRGEGEAGLDPEGDAARDVGSGADRGVGPAAGARVDAVRILLRRGGGRFRVDALLPGFLEKRGPLAGGGGAPRLPAVGAGRRGAGERGATGRSGGRGPRDRGGGRGDAGAIRAGALGGGADSSGAAR